jgi:hypothetical protein
MMPKRGANLETRLDRLAAAIRDRSSASRFDLVQAIAVEHAGGKKPGLYADGPPGSLAGLLVYDPVQGEPRVPEERMSPWGLVIVCEGATWDTVI